MTRDDLKAKVVDLLVDWRTKDDIEPTSCAVAEIMELVDKYVQDKITEVYAKE
jgi:hypothetical protein